MSEKQTSFIAAFFAGVMTFLIYSFNVRPTKASNSEGEQKADVKSYNLPWVDAEHLLDSIKFMDTAYYFTDQVKLIKGHLFSPEEVHIFIRYDLKNDSIIELQRHRRIYLAQSGKHRLLWSDLEESNIYAWPDTIGDINGDGYKDYLQFYWSPSGCCTRECLDTYLFDPRSDTLHHMRFINTVFFPNQKKVVSMAYEHEPDRHLMIWHGFSLDTLESLSIDDITNGTIRIRYRNNKADTIDNEADESVYSCIEYLRKYYNPNGTLSIWPIETISPEKLAKSGKFGSEE